MRVLTDGRAPHRPGQSTVVVLGTARAGTTMTAGVLQILGVEFGDRVDDQAEDVELNNCLHRTRSGLRALSAPFARAQFAALLRARRAQWTNFGFKVPALSRQLWLMSGAIPEATYVCVLRNPLRAAFSQNRNAGAAWETVLHSTTMRQNRIAGFIRQTRRPCAVFAYEDALNDPLALIDELAGFLGVSPTDAQRAEAAAFINPNGGYRATRRSLGAVDTVAPTTVEGWAADLMFPHTPVRVELRLGETVLAQQVAELPRDDVVAAGKHTGPHCGFAFTLDTPLSAADQNLLTVVLPDLQHTLPRVPLRHDKSKLPNSTQV